MFSKTEFYWLDIPALINGAESIFEHLMVGKDPVAQWTFDCVMLLDDAVHPMYPRGSNGSAQAIINGGVLAAQLALAQQNGFDIHSGLLAYQALRRPPRSKIVLTNRSTLPDFIIM